MIKGKNGIDVKKILKMIVLVSVYLATYFIVIFSTEVLFLDIVDFQNVHPFFVDNLGPSFLTLHDLIALPVYFLVLYLIHKKSLFKLSQFVKIQKRTVALSLLLGVCMGAWIMSIIQIPVIRDSYTQFEGLFSFLLTGNFVFVVLFIALHSVYKEIFFRGMIFNQLRNALWLPLAFLITGLIYGYLFFQWDIMLTIYGMLGAIIFNLVYIWYESIWATISVEFSLFMTYFILREMSYGYGLLSNILLLVSSVAFIATMVILYKQRQSALARENHADITQSIQS
ncbi:CPBP family intramembrane glutamic endopeptidase [Chengkuizengella sp. SCS-71B]|uniref:CPBP family intramembrane glutamic endopeptidase n=1 Tax=Chengkuizengella sp. SCS-71B TaxID=3115290 RepID=UPI0032C22DD4